jgi:hypothetical protein
MSDVNLQVHMLLLDSGATTTGTTSSTAANSGAANTAVASSCAIDLSGATLLRAYVAMAHGLSDVLHAITLWQSIETWRRSYRVSDKQFASEAELIYKRHLKPNTALQSAKVNSVILALACLLTTLLAPDNLYACMYVYFVHVVGAVFEYHSVSNTLVLHF